jgi:hypothetical protein
MLHKSLSPPIKAALARRNTVLKSDKKLRLNKETIRNLSEESLGQVAGGKKKDSVLLCNSLAICNNTKAKQTCVTVCVDSLLCSGSC